MNVTSSVFLTVSSVSPPPVKFGMDIWDMSDGRLSASSLLRVWALPAFGVRRES